MDLDPLLLSRLQFAFTIIFHIIFPTFTIGLSAYIATLCVMWMRSGKQHYRVLARFWTKIFALSFAMGVVSGIVLSYQFGTNWSRIKDNIPDKVDIEWFKQGAASSPRSMLPRADGAARPCSGGYVQSGSYCVPKSERSAPATPTIAAAVELTRLVEI
jgi:Cytochrome bd terminal oxidase subunit I